MENMLEGIISLSLSENTVDIDVARERAGDKGIIAGDKALITEISSSSASTFAWSSGDMIFWGV
jgi:hypothetical protein